MSKLAKVVLSREGVRKFLSGKEMLAEVEQRASETVSRLGDGYEMSAMVGYDRAHAFVRAVSYQAMEDSLEDNTILKALR